MKYILIIIAITCLVSTQLKSQKQDSIPHFRKNEIGINMTTPLAALLTAGSSPLANVLELNFKRHLKKNYYGRINAGVKISNDRGTGISNMESSLYSSERIRYKDSYNYYKSENLYNETFTYGSLGVEKRWRMNKILCPVLAVDLFVGKISGSVNTYEQVVSDSTFSNTTPTRPRFNYNTNYDRGDKVYVQKINGWAFGMDVSFGVLINVSKRFYVSAQLVNNIAVITGKLNERDVASNTEINTAQSNLNYNMKGNVNLYYKF